MQKSLKSCFQLQDLQIQINFILCNAKINKIKEKWGKFQDGEQHKEKLFVHILYLLSCSVHLKHKMKNNTTFELIPT